MRTITINGLSIQADVLGSGDRGEAMEAIDAINVAIAGLSSNPQVLGANNIDDSQISVVGDSDDQVELSTAQLWFFETEMHNEGEGGVSPATLASAVDSLTQAPTPVIASWARIPMPDVPDFIKGVKTLMEELGGARELEELLCEDDRG